MRPVPSNNDAPEMGQENQGGGETTLPVASYPELESAAEGQKVTLMGTVRSNDGNDVTIAYDSVQLQENMADKAMGKMRGGAPAKPMPSHDATGGDADEDY